MKHFDNITLLILSVGFAYFVAYKKSFIPTNLLDQIIAFIMLILFIASIWIVVLESRLSKKKFRSEEKRIKKSALLVITFTIFILVIMFIIELLFIFFVRSFGRYIFKTPTDLTEPYFISLVLILVYMIYFKNSILIKKLNKFYKL